MRKPCCSIRGRIATHLELTRRHRPIWKPYEKENATGKKELLYKKERRTGSLHGYVKTYPKTKARINRASRHEANATLKSAGMESSEQAVEVTDDQAITRERLQRSIKRVPGGDFKARPYKLKEWVKDRLEGRVKFAGNGYFAEPYNSAAHRKRFRKHLQTI